MYTPDSWSGAIPCLDILAMVCALKTMNILSPSYSIMSIDINLCQSLVSAKIFPWITANLQLSFLGS